MSDRCSLAHCNKAAHFSCAQCAARPYCCSKCQETDWPVHYTSCSLGGSLVDANGSDTLGRRRRSSESSDSGGGRRSSITITGDPYRDVRMSVDSAVEMVLLASWLRNQVHASERDAQRGREHWAADTAQAATLVLPSLKHKKAWQRLAARFVKALQKHTPDAPFDALKSARGEAYVTQLLQELHGRLDKYKPWSVRDHAPTAHVAYANSVTTWPDVTDSAIELMFALTDVAVPNTLLDNISGKPYDVKPAEMMSLLLWYFAGASGMKPSKVAKLKPIQGLHPLFIEHCRENFPELVPDIVIHDQTRALNAVMAQLQHHLTGGGADASLLQQTAVTLLQAAHALHATTAELEDWTTAQQQQQE